MKKKKFGLGTFASIGLLLIAAVLLFFGILGPSLEIVPPGPTPVPTAEFSDVRTVTMDRFTIEEFSDGCLWLRLNPQPLGHDYAVSICKGDRAELERALSQNRGRTVKLYKDSSGRMVKITFVTPTGETTIWKP
jgi:hypothetical protein